MNKSWALHREVVVVFRSSLQFGNSVYFNDCSITPDLEEAAIDRVIDSIKRALNEATDKHVVRENIGAHEIQKILGEDPIDENNFSIVRSMSDSVSRLLKKDHLTMLANKINNLQTYLKLTSPESTKQLLAKYVVFGFGLIDFDDVTKDLSKEDLDALNKVRHIYGTFKTMFRVNLSKPVTFDGNEGLLHVIEGMFFYVLTLLC